MKTRKCQINTIQPITCFQVPIVGNVELNLTTDEIYKCLCAKAEVIEILPDGRMMCLDFTNYDKTNETNEIEDETVEADEEIIEDETNEIEDETVEADETNEIEDETVEADEEIIEDETNEIEDETETNRINKSSVRTYEVSSRNNKSKNNKNKKNRKI